MYNKIYRNMIFLCSMVLILTLISALIGIYTLNSYNINSTIETSLQSVRSLINNEKNPESIIEALNQNGSELQYTFIRTEDNCDCKNKALCASVQLSDGKFLHAVQTDYSPFSLPLLETVSVLIFFGILVFVLSIRFSAVLAGNIVKPINDNFADEETYDEILPLTRAIEFQNKEIKRQTKNVQAREVELQLITDNMNEGLIIINAKGEILSLNSFASKLFDTDLLNVKHQHFTKISDDHNFVSSIEKALSSNRSNTIIEFGESYYRMYCSPILTNTIVEGAIILLFDITGTYQSEKLRREFSANVSHELKTPLTSIHGYAQLISGRLAKEEDIPGFAEKIAKESNRLMILIEDIMRLSNLDEGIEEPENTENSAIEIVKETIDLLENKASERNISLSFSGDDFTVKINRSQFSEMIYNICDNAIKYNKDNGSVSIKLSENSISVSDTGIGISPEHLDRIFERFYRVDKSHSKKVDGTGLGLSIVKHIAMQNNIKIDIKSSPGEGSVFTLDF